MKHVLYLVCALALSAPIFGQTEIGNRKVRLGFKLDPVFLNNLKPADDGIKKDGAKFGVSYGVMADFLFNDEKGAFATGLEIVHAGGNLKYEAGSNKGLRRNEATTANAAQYYDIKLQYIQIPLSLKLKTEEKNKFTWWGQFGTYTGFLIGSRTDIRYGNVSEDKVKANKYMVPLNMGLLLGAGGEYSIAEKTDLYFGLGFESGFTDITRNKRWDDDKVTLKRWALRVGIFL